MTEGMLYTTGFSAKFWFLDVCISDMIEETLMGLKGKMSWLVTLSSKW